MSAPDLRDRLAAFVADVPGASGQALALLADLTRSRPRGGAIATDLLCLAEERGVRVAAEAALDAAASRTMECKQLAERWRKSDDPSVDDELLDGARAAVRLQAQARLALEALLEMARSSPDLAQRAASLRERSCRLRAVDRVLARAPEAFGVGGGDVAADVAVLAEAAPAGLRAVVTAATGTLDEALFRPVIVAPAGTVLLFPGARAEARLAADDSDEARTLAELNRSLAPTIVVETPAGEVVVAGSWASLELLRLDVEWPWGGTCDALDGASARLGWPVGTEARATVRDGTVLLRLPPKVALEGAELSLRDTEGRSLPARRFEA